MLASVDLVSVMFWSLALSILEDAPKSDRQPVKPFDWPGHQASRRGWGGGWKQQPSQFSHLGHASHLLHDVLYL